MNHKQTVALLEMEVAKYEAALTILATRCEDKELATKIHKLVDTSRADTEKVIAVEELRIE